MKKIIFITFALTLGFSGTILLGQGRDYENNYCHNCPNPDNVSKQEIDYIYNTYVLPDVLSRPTFDPNDRYDKAYVDESDDRWHVSYKFADLDGTGTKDYLVAEYYLSFSDEALIICKKAGNSWSLIYKGGVYGAGAECVKIKDVDNDGKDEVLFSWGTFKKGALSIMKKVGSDLIILNPHNNDLDTDFLGNEGAEVTDEDGDGIYEVIVSPDYDYLPFAPNPETGEKGYTEYHHGYRLYKLVNGQYQFVKEWDSRPESGEINSTLGVMHPAEMPISEILNVPDEDTKASRKSGGTGVAVRFFVGGLASTQWADVDWGTVKVFNDIPVTFVKIWDNDKENQGVKNTVGFLHLGFHLKEYKNDQHFTIQPSDPALPCMTFYPGYACHFIGKYAEFKAEKKAVLRKLKAKITSGKFDQANDAFMFIPYRGKMTDGSLFGGAAFLVIQPNWQNRQAARAERAKRGKGKPTTVKKPAPLRKPKP